MDIKTLSLQITPSAIMGDTSFYDASEVMDFSKYAARKRRHNASFYQEFVEKAHAVKAQPYKTTLDLAKLRTWSYDIDADILLFETLRAQCSHTMVHNGNTHLTVTFPDWDGRGHYLSSPGGRFTLPLHFFLPNHDPQETEDWIDLFFDRQRQVKKAAPCPECKDTGKVTLFQFTYACSLCGDGKRI